MKYLDIKTVVNSYNGFQKGMTNKSWGYLALLKGCKNIIYPSMPYEVDMNEVANFLENIFNLSPNKKQYNGLRSLFVIFSKQWDQYFKAQGTNVPNIYDVAVWAYRRESFQDNITADDILKRFAEEFNIPVDIISDSFDTSSKKIDFSNTLYTESDLKSELKGIGVDVSKDNIDAKKAGVVAAPGEMSRGPFVQPLYAAIEVTDYIIILQSDYYSLYGVKITNKSKATGDSTIQKIYYGTPGSGKSHKVKNVVEGLYSDEQEREKYVFRTTFHPDSDYASFVGCYKPTKDKASSQGKSEMSVDDLAVSLKQYYNDDNFGKIGGLQRFCYDYERYLNKLDRGELSKILEKAGLSSNYEIEIKKYLGFQKLISNKKTGGITYEFVPQAFTNAYVKAWLEPDKQVYLIIEEINRGNCAQIFGDLFQLLDRKDGVSEYPINADADLRQYLEKDEVLGEDSEGIANGKLKLPANLNILATMNTSDQSLFPMDSAFKRRWTWECVPIDYENADSSKFMIKINGKVYNWHKFLKNVNERIKSVTLSEDKQMGNFFISSNIDERQFIDKVMFYLWNDICKEEYKTTNNFFRNYTNDAKTDKVEFTFNDLFDKTQNGDNKLLVGFMEYIGVEAE